MEQRRDNLDCWTWRLLSFAFERLSVGDIQQGMLVLLSELFFSDASMQISTLIFAPAFLAAFWYILLGKLIAILGPQYCRFTPKLYTIW